MEQLAVCTVVENPLGWKSRYINYKHFSDHVKASGAKLYTVEIAYADRPFQIYNEGGLQLRTNCEIWHKENALNLMMQMVTEEKVAWIDADVMFARPDWVEETLKQLDHYPVVQMFSHTINLGSDYHPKPDGHDGYIYQWIKSNRKTPTNEIRTGLAWAARKSVLSKLGMLIDWAIVGGGDHHMASALIGDVHSSLHDNFSHDYKAKCVYWEDLALEHIQTKVGYVPGLALHYWHGSHSRREYKTKPNIMIKNDYEPSKHIMKDWQGLNYLVSTQYRLQRDIMDFLRRRDDDSIEADRLIA